MGISRLWSSWTWFDIPGKRIIYSELELPRHGHGSTSKVGEHESHQSGERPPITRVQTVEAEANQTWSLELPRYGPGLGSKAEPSETKWSSITRKGTLQTALGRSAKAFASAVAAIAKDNMESHPGTDNSGSNTGIHGAYHHAVQQVEEYIGQATALSQS